MHCQKKFKHQNIFFTLFSLIQVIFSETRKLTMKTEDICTQAHHFNIPFIKGFYWRKTDPKGFVSKDQAI